MALSVLYFRQNMMGLFHVTMGHFVFVMKYIQSIKSIISFYISKYRLLERIRLVLSLKGIKEIQDCIVEFLKEGRYQCLVCLLTLALFI